jgi:hypothetical protein
MSDHFYSLLIHQVVHERGAHFCNLFGSYVCGLFETKEITNYSEMQKCRNVLTLIVVVGHGQTLFLLLVEDNK